MRGTKNEQKCLPHEASSWPIRRGEYFLKRMSSSRAPRECSVLGVPFSVVPGVFSPALSRSTEFFARKLVKGIEGKSIFEVGCGSGAISVLCALKGASRVICSDVSDAAIECTRLNASRHGVEDKIELVTASDFDDVAGHFDIVFFALPYVYVDDVRSIFARFGALAYSIFDEKYRAQRLFFEKAPKYVTPGGRILVGFSKVGVLDRFFSNVRKASCTANLVASEPEGRTDNRFYQIVPNESRDSSQHVAHPRLVLPARRQGTAESRELA